MRPRRLSALARKVASACIALVLAACTASNPGPTGVGSQITGVTVTAASSSVATGLTVQLAAQVQPSGSPQGVTWSTSAGSIATVDAAGLVLGVSSGTVTITATSTSDPAQSGSIQLTVTGCPTPRMVNSNLTASTTWQNWINSPMCFDYVVTTNIAMTTGILTIEPGSVIGFETNLRLELSRDASVKAMGTSSDPIDLKGTQGQRGFWGGLLFKGQTKGNVLEYTNVEDGGGVSYSGSIPKSAVTIIESSEVTLRNSSIQESGGYGLYAHFSTTPALENTTIYNNASGPAYVYASNAHIFAASKGNALNAFNQDPLDVQPNEVDGSVTWEALGIAYRILENNSKQAFDVTGDLKLDPATVITFEKDMGLIVSDGGSIEAVGTQANPVTLTGTSAVRGFWRGVQLQNTDSRFEWVIIEYGGGPGGSSSLKPADLVLSTGAASPVTQLTMLNSTLRESAAYGMYARAQNVSIPKFSSNTLTMNALGPAYVAATHVDELMDDGTYTGNDVQEMTIYTSTAPITQDATWRDLGVPFRLDGTGGGPFLVQDATLTIEPGVEIQFDQGMAFDFEQANLSAVGTAMKPIGFRGVGAPWQGILLHDSNGAFDYITIADAGIAHFGGAQQAGNVTLISSQMSANADFGGNVSWSGASYGLVFTLGATFAHNCTAMAPFYVPPPDTPPDHCN
jgi:Bacterial Ig-like domain (group 2)